MMVKERRLQRESGKKAEVKRGTWTAEEDQKLVSYVVAHGDKHWRTLPSKAGLKRCGKSCRLRWLNYLRPDIKRGNFSEDEEDLIIRLHNLLGNRWSIIAGRIPGRTDNEIKNHWNTNLRKTPLSMEELNSKQKRDPNYIASTATFSPPTNQIAPVNIPSTVEVPPSTPWPADKNQGPTVSSPWVDQAASKFDVDIKGLSGVNIPSTVEVPPSTLWPADKNQGPTVSSPWVDQAASKFDVDIQGLSGFSNELGLDDFGLPPSYLHDNTSNQDQFFEFEDLEQWFDYQQAYALNSDPISG